MKHTLFFFLFIHLITSNFNNAIAQELHLSLKGADSKQDSILKTFKIDDTYKNATALKSALKDLSESIKQEGYLDLRINNFSNRDTIYIVNINLGPHYREIRIHFENPVIESYLKKLNIDVKQNYFITETRNTSQLLGKLTNLEADNGYPLSEFKLNDISKKGYIVLAHLILNRENKRILDNITIKGYEKFPLSFIKHYARLKEGQIFDKKQIVEKAELLNELNFATQKRPPEILFGADSTSVYLYLEKDQSNTFDGFLGFGSDEDSGRLKLDGYLDLSLNNNLNYGESLTLNYKSDGNDQQTLSVDLELPFLFSSPIGAEVSLNLFRKDSTFSTSHQQLALFYQINKLRLNGCVEFEKSIKLIGVGLSYMKGIRRDILPPNDSFSIYGAYGSRNVKNDNDSQFQIITSGEYNFLLNPKHQININNTTRILFSDTYLSNELFRFGGNKSIRGFKENSINANLLSVFRTEYRYQPVSNLYLHTITDAAYFENALLNENDFIYSLGFGAGILTRAGILNISIANGFQNENKFKFSESILHISLKANF